MTLDAFTRSLDASAVPDLPPLLRALWHDAKGQWDNAHSVAQEIDTPRGAWVHAYLHRKEGDIGNARYWYRRAGQPEATDTLTAEWARIVTGLLADLQEDV